MCKRHDSCVRDMTRFRSAPSPMSLPVTYKRYTCHTIDTHVLSIYMSYIHTYIHTYAVTPPGFPDRLCTRARAHTHTHTRAEPASLAPKDFLIDSALRLSGSRARARAHTHTDLFTHTHTHTHTHIPAALAPQGFSDRLCSQAHQSVAACCADSRA
jgi:hypothetical protein